MPKPTVKEIIDFEKDRPKMVNRELVEDMVNHPPHYNQRGIECVDAIEAATDIGFEYYLQGNIIKYLWSILINLQYQFTINTNCTCSSNFKRCF